MLSFTFSFPFHLKEKRLTSSNKVDILLPSLCGERGVIKVVVDVVKSLTLQWRKCKKQTDYLFPHIMEESLLVLGTWWHKPEHVVSSSDSWFTTPGPSKRVQVTNDYKYIPTCFMHISHTYRFFWLTFSIPKDSQCTSITTTDMLYYCHHFLDVGMDQNH